MSEELDTVTSETPHHITRILVLLLQWLGTSALFVVSKAGRLASEVDTAVSWRCWLLAFTDTTDVNTAQLLADSGWPGWAALYYAAGWPHLPSCSTASPGRTLHNIATDTHTSHNCQEEAHVHWHKLHFVELTFHHQHQIIPFLIL